MNSQTARYLLLLLLLNTVCFLATAASLQQPVQHNSSGSVTAIAENVMILEKESAYSSVGEVLKKNFTPHNGGVLNLGLSNVPVWIKFDLKNNTEDSALFLKAGQPVIDSITLYIFSNNVLEDSIALGEYKLFKNRPVNNPDYIFPVTIEQGGTRTFLLRVRSDDPIQLPLAIGSAETMVQVEQSLGILFGIYAGIIIIMILYNALISVSVKDRSYIYYVFFVLFVGLTQAVLKGYAFQYLWPHWPSVARSSTIVVPTLSGITTGLFMKSFLNLKRAAPIIDRGVSVFIGIYILAGLTGLFYNFQSGIIFLQSIAFTGSIFALGVGLWLLYKGHRIAVFFAVAYSVFLTAIIIFVLCNFNILPYNNFTAYVLEIGSVIQITLLSLALADKINTYRRARTVARREALRALKENERLIREQNVLLEREVKVRTTELENANTSLNQTLEQLKTAQAKLVDSEKMASLGQLTAGVAHEINNPINFVASNIKPLQLDIDDIFGLLDKYKKIDAGANIEAQLQEIEAYKKQIDIDYLGEEINTLLSGIKEGADRTAEIVRNLKDFARVDQSNMKFVNLNEGLESTLMLVRNSFPSDLVTEIHLGDLPNVECVPGKINQVFMNIITNASHAIKAKKYSGGEQPVLTIKSWPEEENVKIMIKDNGIGMSREVVEKIYEPFFTTKRAGEGIGLGMSIVKGIINNHQGNLKVISEAGKGAEFILTLPVRSTVK